MADEIITAPATPVAPAAPAAPAPGADIGAPAAPVIPAAPAAAPAPAPAAASGVVYDATGHAGLDLALNFVGGLGIGPEDAAIKAAETGDFSLLKAKLATMGDKAKGWESMLAVGEQDFTRIREGNEAKRIATEATFAGSVGGKEQWDTIKSWASTNAEPAEKQAINAALAAGGIAAKAMVLYLGQIHSGQPTVSAPPQKQAVSPAAASTTPESAALSPRAYVAEVQKLRATVRGAIEDSPAYKALQSRRAAWRG